MSMMSHLFHVTTALVVNA